MDVTTGKDGVDMELSPKTEENRPYKENRQYLCVVVTIKGKTRISKYISRK